MKTISECSTSSQACETLLESVDALSNRPFYSADHSTFKKINQRGNINEITSLRSL